MHPGRGRSGKGENAQEEAGGRAGGGKTHKKRSASQPGGREGKNGLQLPGQEGVRQTGGRQDVSLGCFSLKLPGHHVGPAFQERAVCLAQILRLLEGPPRHGHGGSGPRQMFSQCQATSPDVRDPAPGTGGPYPRREAGGVHLPPKSPHKGTQGKQTCTWNVHLFSP